MKRPRTKPTFKQKAFAKEYVRKKGNATQAALQVYDTTYDDAQVIGSQNLNKPIVIEEINKILAKQGLNDEEWIASKLIVALDSGIGIKATNSDSIKVLDMMLKLKNAYPNNVKKNVNLNLSNNRSQESMEDNTKLLRELNSNTMKLLEELKS